MKQRVLAGSLAAFAGVGTLTFGLVSVGGAQDVDCPGLSQEEAQRILDQDPSDPNRLDADHDGVACEANSSGGGTSSPSAPSAPRPTPGQPRLTG
jgi:Excalibur calcium-binding domain